MRREELRMFFADTWVMYPLFFSSLQINLGGIYGIYNSIRRCKEENHYKRNEKSSRKRKYRRRNS